MLFGSILSPFKKSVCSPMCILSWLSLGSGVPQSSCPVRIKSGSGFHTGHGWFFFALSEGMSSSFCVWVPLVLSNLCGVLPRPAKICLAFFAAGALRLAFSAVALRRCAVLLGFRGSVGRRLAVFLSLSLSLSLSSRVVPFVFLLFGAATLFLMPRPLLGRLWGSRAFWPPGLPSTGRPGERASARPAVVAGCRPRCLPHICEH